MPKSLYTCFLLFITMVKYMIEVDKELWEKFKEIVSKNKSINDVIVEMIKERVHNRKL